MNDIQVLQNKIARLVTNSDKRRHRSEIFDESKWFTVRQLTVYHTLITVNKIRCSKEQELLPSIIERENIRGKIIIPMSNLT